MTQRGRQQKQRQHRLPKRAPHGAPVYTKRITACITPAQRALFDAEGGSAFVREAIDLYAAAHGGRPPREKRPETRADVLFVHRIGAMVTVRQHRLFKAGDGSAFVRRAIEHWVAKKKGAKR